MDPKLGSTLGYLVWRCYGPLRSLISSNGSNNWSREMNLKSLKNRLSKLEQMKRKMAIEADCICFPPDQPPVLLLQAEREAARGSFVPASQQTLQQSGLGPLSTD